jgi:hypothetical protein
VTRALVLVALCGCGGVLDVSDASPPPPPPPPIDASIVDVGVPEIAVVEASPGPFSPNSLDNLVLWLDASTLVTINTSGHVTGWGDRSKYSNAAGASSAGAPLVSTGKTAAIHFDTSAMQYLLIASAPSLELGTADYAIAFVARYTNVASDGVVSGAPNFFFKSGLSVWGNVPLSNNTVNAGFLFLENATTYVSDPTSHSDGAFHLFVVRRTSQSLEIRVDGASTATAPEASAVDVSAPGEPVIIGAVSSAYYRILGDLAELVVLNAATSPADFSALETYFTTKYVL